MPLIARLNRLTDPNLLEQSERYESFRDGGGGMVLREDVALRHAKLSTSAEAGENGLSILALADGAIVEATSHALEFPEDWRDYESLETSVQAGDERILVQCSVLGARNRMVQETWIEPGQTHRFSFDLRDLPLAAGTRPPFAPTGVKLQIRWGDTWKTEGDWVKVGGDWPGSAHNQPVSCHWLGLQLGERQAKGFCGGGRIWPAPARQLANQSHQR